MKDFLNQPVPDASKCAMPKAEKFSGTGPLK
nr:MAG TPA: hypothetical protein [Caudoviricetes sp.]